MTTPTGQAPAAPAPGSAPDQSAAPWFGNDFASLVQTKGWANPNDALKSYSELEKHIGAPADRLIRVPDKPELIDDNFRADVFKRLNYAPPSAPEKPEDYGIQLAEGTPPEYGAAIAAAAHKAGIPKEAMTAIFQANDAYVKQHMEAAQAAEAQTITDRVKAADAAIAQRFGAKAPQMQELMVREAQRLGLDADAMTKMESALALTDDKALGLFRNLLADVAEARMESPLHRNADQRMVALTPEQAQQQLGEKRRNTEWVTKALQRGTVEAEENIRLNALASGVVMTAEEVKRQAAGLGPTG
jgi:hypothetical protein